MIDHNLIYDHDSFVVQEIINSGMLMIILAILKLFIDDRNSFSYEQWEKLHQIKSQPTPLEESVITQSNEEVKTDPLLMTSITTPIENILETREIPNTGTSTLRTEELSLQNLMDNEKEKNPSNVHTEEPEGREKLCTRVMNETTLRIYCLKKSNT